jgi:cell division protein FtsW
VRERGSEVVVTVRRIFAAENANYFLLLGTTLFLVAFGLVMVLSSSSVESLAAEGENPFSSFLRQGLYAIIGLPLMLVASRFRASFWKKWAWPILLASFVFQLLVFVPGISAGNLQGNTNWVRLFGFTAQPSEFMKLALAIWIAYMISRRQHVLDDWRFVFIPILPPAAVGILLVLAGNDLGTAIIMLAIVAGCLFFAGLKLRYLFTAGIGMAVLGLLVAATGASRSSRIQDWITGCATLDSGKLDSCWQPVHGTWALAAGGVFGVGLGNSKMKWSWLPAADNDYIFAIIGEELGLVGAVVVLLLFVVLAIAFVRIIRAARDPFARVVVGGVLVWLIGQAFVNIAVVLGLLPVLGVPLPLISAGGSALIANLIAIGVVLSLTRHPEEIVEVDPLTPREFAVPGGRAFRS